MSSQKYDSKPIAPMQELDLNDAEWEEVVKKRLPGELEVQARQLKAWSRQRELRSVSDLLRALLVYACCHFSFRELGMWALLKGVGSLSERAWRKRLDRSRAWISWLLSELLGAHQTPSWMPTGAGRILLIDATRFKTPGGTGDDVRLHQSYELRAGRMEQVQLTDRHQAESLAHFVLQPGDLVVTDAGYAVDSSVERTRQSQSMLLQRTAASQVHLEDEQGRVIGLRARIKHLPGNCLTELRAWVRLPHSGERAPVRVLCYRLPAEQARKARERKAAKLRKKHGPHYNQELVWWASWVLLVTTTDAAQWSGRDLLRLYRARWQIELLFKRIKQCLHLHAVPVKDWHRASSLLHLHLIGWWLQEQEAAWLREVVTSVLPADPAAIRGWESDEESDVRREVEGITSSWTLAHFCCEQVRTMLRGAWTRQRIQECQHGLRRYVTSGKRKRGHRESEQRAWLQTRCSQLGQRRS
jgi:Transposase DDE domain